MVGRLVEVIMNTEDANEVDYFGIPITTRTKEDCTDTMMYEVLIGEHYHDDTPVIERGKGGCPPEHTWLSEKDRELLIEYAPKLFDTLPQGNDLLTAMQGLVTLIGKHRFEIVWQRSEKARMNHYSYSKKNAEEKADALKKHIEAIVKIIGIDTYIDKGEMIDIVQNGKKVREESLRTPKDDLLEELANAYENPMRYLPIDDAGYSLEHNEHGETIKVLHHTQEPMYEYLKALHLKNRSAIIKEFIKKLTDQDYFSTFLVKQQRPPKSPPNSL